MDAQLLVLCALTFVIYLIGALAYAARIAGVRTRKIAVSFALFNVLVLVSRAANSFQGPFLSKRIELTLLKGGGGLFWDFQVLMFSATLAAIVGTLMVPTVQRLFTRAIQHFHANRSIPKLIMHSFARGGLGYLKDSVTVPSIDHVKGFKAKSVVSLNVFVLNDPQLSVMTDDVVEGRISEASFRRAVVWLAGSRILGTALAQALLVPA